ncbi:hypothetical protein [Halopseudomonas salegens]|uniref:Uncharacterized protein n=1 Tax=Halopseudomonas salegens TaxID=1434072 RepID=A0A1H2HTQ0_9GAMM|nr:hypothetical protein [Halopseudomonas salegens]SDU35273.1 hypothetical protein SAMN05216210_3305 [Halopseudomonas salegens]
MPKNVRVSKLFLVAVHMSFLILATQASAHEIQFRSECKPPYTISTFEEMVIGITPVIALQDLINLDETERASESIQIFLAGFIEPAYNFIERGCEVSVSAKKRLHELTRVLAVMNEKYPQEIWESNENIMRIFEEAKRMDPDHTARLRMRDWSRPL